MGHSKIRTGETGEQVVLYVSTGEMGHLVAGETDPVLSLGATVLTRQEDVDT